MPRVNVIDSETVTMPMAFLCRVAAECATLEEATTAVEARIPKCRVLALLDTLRYIEKDPIHRPRCSGIIDATLHLSARPAPDSFKKLDPPPASDSSNRFGDR